MFGSGNARMSRSMGCASNLGRAPLFCFLDASDARRLDIEFFRNIDEQMKTGGLEAMLHDLASLKQPAWVELRDPPRTAALMDQIEHGLKPHHRWIETVLKWGAFGSAVSTLRPTDGSKLDEMKSKKILADLVYQAYGDYATEHRVQYPAARSQIGTLLGELGVCRRRVGKKNASHYEFPSLAAMRNTATEKFGFDFGELVSVDETGKAVGEGELGAWTDYGCGGVLPSAE